jgi:aconitate hydratase
LLRPEGRNERDPKARGNPPAKATIDQAQYTCGLLDWEEVKGGSIMGNNLARQLIADHLVEGEMRPGEEIALKIDQFLLHDGTGPLCALQLEAMGVEQISGDTAVAYCDHLLVEADSKNADDHILLQSAARRFGMWFSRPGNGTSHPVHQQRFGVPGKTLLGADSHTPERAL